MVTIKGTAGETDNIIEIIASAGACDICPGKVECEQHGEEPENREFTPWENLSCGEIIRKNVNIVIERAAK